MTKQDLKQPDNAENKAQNASGPMLDELELQLLKGAVEDLRALTKCDPLAASLVTLSDNISAILCATA